MEVFLVYLWLKLDSFLRSLVVVGLCLLYSLIIYIFGKSNCREKEEKQEFADKWWKSVKKAVYAGIFCLFVVLVAPSSKQTAILVGTSYAVDFAKSPEGAKIGELIRKKANDYLDEQLKEAQKPNNKAGNRISIIL